MLLKGLNSHYIHRGYGTQNVSKGKAGTKTLKVVVVMGREHFEILQSGQGSNR